MAKHLTSRELERELGRSRSTISKWRRRGMPFAGKVGRSFLYSLQDVRAWIRDVEIREGVGGSRQRPPVSKLCARCGEISVHSVKWEIGRKPRPAPYCRACKSAENKAYKQTPEGRAAASRGALGARAKRIELRRLAEEARRRGPRPPVGECDIRLLCSSCGGLVNRGARFIGGTVKHSACRVRDKRKAAQARRAVCSAKWAWCSKAEAALWRKKVAQAAGRANKGAPGAVTAGELLDILFAQGNGGRPRCAYTGALLFARPRRSAAAPRGMDTASLDHVVAVSRGGRTTPGNLVWCTARANNMKGELDGGDFVRLCTHIAAHARQKARQCDDDETMGLFEGVA